MPPDMTRLSDYAKGATLMAEEPGDPDAADVPWSIMPRSIPASPRRPFVLSVLGPDRLSNWDSSDMGRLSREARPLAAGDRSLSRSDLSGSWHKAWSASSFNSALSVPAISQRTRWRRLRASRHRCNSGTRRIPKTLAAHGDPRPVSGVVPIRASAGYSGVGAIRRRLRGCDSARGVGYTRTDRNFASKTQHFLIRVDVKGAAILVP